MNVGKPEATEDYIVGRALRKEAKERAKNKFASARGGQRSGMGLEKGKRRRTGEKPRWARGTPDSHQSGELQQLMGVSCQSAAP